MRTLLFHLGPNTILLILALIALLVFRLLGFGIGPKSWTSWFWGESSEKGSAPAASK